MRLFRVQAVPLQLLSILLQIALIIAILLSISIIECKAQSPEIQAAPTLSSSSVPPLINNQPVPHPPEKRTQSDASPILSSSPSPTTEDNTTPSSVANNPKSTPTKPANIVLQETPDHTTEPANDTATTPTSRKPINDVGVACIVIIPTLVLALGIGLAINVYIRRRKRAHNNKGTNYSTGDDTFGTREISRTDSNHSQKSQNTRKPPERQQQQRTHRIFRGGSLDLRRSSAVTRSVGRAGLPQTWNSRSASFSHAINRPVAVPAPAMLETGKASGVLSDASAFPPVPGPSRPLQHRARAGLGENRALDNRWTVTIDTSDMQVVPLPPPNYKDALKEPPAPADV
jgi:cytoskeletal protein RodZ